MAYRPRDLNVIGYANGFTLWHYRASDAAETCAPGFFAAAADMVCAGDIILVSAPESALQLFVAEAVPGAIVRGTIERRPGIVRVTPMTGLPPSGSGQQRESATPDGGTRAAATRSFGT
jgi:hypothetical protein